MTTSPVDPNRLILTGENPFMRLSETDGGPNTTDASLWRIRFSPGGPGHVLFIQSELTDGEPTIYTDNVEMTRWIQTEILSRNPSFGNLDIPQKDASFWSSGDLRSYWTESLSTGDEEISLTWYDLGEPFLVHSIAGSNPERPHGVCTVIIPAGRARLILDGRFAAGRPFPRQRDNRASSTCCLAFSESWLVPA